MHDSIRNPAHYADPHGGIECIEAIQASMSTEEFKGFLKGKIQQFLWRYAQKNGAEDLKKAKWYLEALIAVKEVEESMTPAVPSKKDEDNVVNHDPDAYMISGCPDGFCPMPNVRQGPPGSMFPPIAPY